MNDKRLSALKLVNIFFEEFSFARLEFDFKELDKEVDVDEKISFKVEIATREDKLFHRVKIASEVAKDAEYKLSLVIVGIFQFDSEVYEDVNLEHLLNENAVAILMPYIRSQVSILTSQPGMKTVTLPIFNISEMMKEKE